MSPPAVVAPSSSAGASGGPAETPPATPAPTLPAQALRRAAHTDADGVRVTIILERNPLPAGEATWVTTRVTNTGRDDMIWFHDGCAITVGVGAYLDAARWREGRPQAIPALTWKEYLLDIRDPDARGIYVDFTPEAFIGRGSIGCADIGIGDRIKPGATIEQRLQWDGLGDRQLAPPPTDHVDLVGTLRYYWRASDGDNPGDIPSRTIDVHLDAWIEGDDVAWLHPAEAVDAALLDPRLTDILGTRDLHYGNERILRFDRRTGLYEIGMLESGSLPVSRAHYTQVDARTGGIVGFVDRDWDYDVDGFP